MGEKIFRRAHVRRRAAVRPPQTILITFVISTLAVVSTLMYQPTARAATLLFSDEFTGAAGSAPSSAKWNWETGGGGWGNNEWQTYTSSRSNSYLDGSGRLVIAGRYDGLSLTSARMNTYGKFAFTYGTVSARIKLPAGKGLLPAFWLMGTDLYSVGWPANGEIDVIETPNNGLSYHTTLHGPTTTGAHWQRGVSGSFSGVDLTNDFHVYSVTKSQNLIQTKIDGTVVATFRSTDLASNQRWVFNKPTYVLLNLAIGGNWPGDPDLTTPNLSNMIVDWIRAYSL